MNDLTTIYLVFLLSVFCACVVLIAISCFWDCFKAEIMQTKQIRKERKEMEESENDGE